MVRVGVLEFVMPRLALQRSPEVTTEVRPAGHPGVKRDRRLC